jgi:acylphosphatase
VICVHVVVEGQVQGVFYRQGCQRVAVSNRVTGWVRNNRDGSVEAVLEGERDAVERVVAWMRVGPPQALVTSVVTKEEAPANLSTFTVR